MRRDDEPRAALAATLGVLAGDPGGPFGEVFLPPPDVFGHLADRGIQRHDVRAVCDHVRSHWPRVVRVDCGIDCWGVPHFDVQLDPFSWSDIAGCRPLAEWVRGRLPGRDLSVHFFPVLDPDRVRASVTVFDRPADAAGDRSPS